MKMTKPPSPLPDPLFFEKIHPMRVLLVNPRIEYASTNDRLNDFLSRQTSFPRRYPPLALLLLAALTPDRDEITYIDENVRPIDFEASADVIAISCMTPQATRAYEIADAFRARGIRVILGGVHPTVLPQDAAPHADAVLVGEAESVWRTLLGDARRGRLRPLYHGPLSDLRRSPPPRYDLLGRGDFLDLPAIFFPVQFSRGCPRNCSFCSVTLLCGRRHRMKSSAQMQKEIHASKPFQRFGNIVIRLNDANPLMHRLHAKTMVRAIAQMHVKWLCVADIDIGRDPELLDGLAASGCVVLGIGFESFDSNVLSELSPWKHRRLTSYARSVRAIQQRGIMVAGNIILGLKRHTQDDLRRICDFAAEHHLFLQYTIATPYPGTRFYHTLQQEGRLLPHVPWSEYNSFNVVFRTKMDPHRIAEDLCWLYEQSQARQSLDMFRAPPTRFLPLKSAKRDRMR